MPEIGHSGLEPSGKFELVRRRFGQAPQRRQTRCNFIFARPRRAQGVRREMWNSGSPECQPKKLIISLHLRRISDSPLRRVPALLETCAQWIGPMFKIFFWDGRDLGQHFFPKSLPNLIYVIHKFVPDCNVAMG